MIPAFIASLLVDAEDVEVGNHARPDRFAVLAHPCREELGEDVHSHLCGKREECVGNRGV